MRLRDTWFRHLFTLRPFVRGAYVEKGVYLGLSIGTIWDEGMHANRPLLITLSIIKWWVQFGIKDTN